MRPIVLILPYPVSANRYWGTRVIRSKHTGQQMALTYVTAEAKAYKDQVGKVAMAAGLRLPFEGRVQLQVQLYPQQPQDYAKRARLNPNGWDDDVRCIDLGNCEKVLSDALNGIAWIDDKQLRRIELERMEPVGEAHLVVTISKYERARIAQDLFAATG